jgi:hypothetical protein
MPAMPISLAHMQFQKKGDAAAYLKDMLRRYDVGDRVNADDSVILRAALERHPDNKAKIGCGINHFSVRTADFGSKCFWVTRIDGTAEKFSLTACVKGV